MEATQRGRPRRFEAGTEREILLDAGFAAMRRNGYQDASVADVLKVAGLSARAFYRHFPTKDALLLALLRRDALAVAERLQRAADRADDAEAKLNAWLDGYLDVFYEPRRAARVAIFASRAAQRADGYEEEMAATRRMLAAPLIDVLRAGARAGRITSSRPEHDAAAILAIATSVCDPLSAAHFGNHGDAGDQVRRFCWPALGLGPHPGAGRPGRTRA